MASASMISTSAVASAPRATPAQSSTVAPFVGLKSMSSYPVTRKSSKVSLPSNGCKVQCMMVWPPENKKKFETLSYLPPLDREALANEISYLMRMGWIPCLEFEVGEAYIHREYHNLPGYYDGRYWTMWKLPMYGCTDPAQVLKEVDECSKLYPHAHVRILGFDNKRQVQCISFIAYKPPPGTVPPKKGKKKSFLRTSFPPPAPPKPPGLFRPDGLF